MAKKQKTTDSKKELLTTLRSLIKNLDEEGLIFMIEQGNILRYNMEVDKVNTIQKSKNPTKKNTVKNSTSSVVKIIMDDDKKNFILQISNQRKFLTRLEFREIVKISHISSLSTASIKLYQWLYAERRDVLMDCGIHNNGDPILKTVVKIVKKNYKAKK